MENVANDIIEGLNEALDFVRDKKTNARVTVVQVDIPEEIDVAAIRRELGMTRQAFASNFGFSLPTLVKWEQGTRQPEGPARAYLTVIRKDPKAVQRALRPVAA